MKKILVVFTGGTIGSKETGGWIAPNDSAKAELIARYEQKNGTAVQFDTLSPYSILSENLGAEELNLLVKTVWEAASTCAYDGIVVTHGTDTLQFSAAALSLALGGTCPPVVLVSSNYPLSDPRANGHANFAAAVRFISEGVFRGVFAAYRNEEGGPVCFYEGQTLCAHAESGDALTAVGGAFAKEENGAISVLGAVPEHAPLGVTPLCAVPHILVLDAHPAAPFDMDPVRYRAVLLRPYHSGTINTESTAFEVFCRVAKECGTPVFLSGARRDDVYASAREFERLGIIPVVEKPFAATYLRLWAAISREEDLKTLFC